MKKPGYGRALAAVAILAAAVAWTLRPGVGTSIVSASEPEASPGIRKLGNAASQGLYPVTALTDPETGTVCYTIVGRNGEVAMDCVPRK